jgi:hypothetical protein
MKQGHDGSASCLTVRLSRASMQSFRSITDLDAVSQVNYQAVF